MGRFFSSGQNYRRGTKRLVDASSILKSVLRRHGLDKEIARYQFVTKWEQIVGPEIAKRAQPERFRAKTLIIRVVDPIWAQELALRKEVLLNRLRAVSNDDQVIDDIQFCVGMG